MTKIKKYVEMIDEELEGAKNYAERYVECKSKNNTAWANKWKECATDELKHSTYIHDYAVMEIEELNKVFKPTQEMQERWDKSHKEYVEKVAWIRTMLAM